MNIAPGESGSVHVRLRVAGIGLLTEYLRSLTDDPAQPSIYLSISATGTAGVVAAPSMVIIHRGRGETASAQVRVAMPLDARRTAAYCQPDPCEVTPLPSRDEAQGRLARPVIRPMDNLPAGTHEARLVIDTGQADGAPLVLPVRMSIDPCLWPLRTSSRLSGSSPVSTRSECRSGASTAGCWSLHISAYVVEGDVISGVLNVVTDLEGEPPLI